MKHKQGKRCLSFLLTLVMLLGLLPTGLFTVTARAEDSIVYDSTATNFSFKLSTGNTNDDLSDDYLLADGYKGTATAAQIPETVSVNDLGWNPTMVAEYTAAGVTELPVTIVASRFSAGSQLTHIRLGANIETINAFAFTAIKDTLVDVDIPYNSKLTTIATNAFGGSITEDTVLERIGITTEDGTRTDKLPATVSSIHSYAFYHTSSLKSIDLSEIQEVGLAECAFAGSGISSIVLPEGLTSTGWNVFNGCRNLTTITLPAGMGYIGPYSFQDCTALTKLVFKGGVSNIGANLGGAYLSLWGINPNCTVYVPQPTTQTDYDEVVSRVYGHMGASATVKLRWLNRDTLKEMAISPKPAPAARSSNVVTLSGTYKDAPYSGFTYDYKDSDGDGLGGVIVLDGKLTNDLTLKLDGNSANASNTSQVVWRVADAYYMRRGTDEVGFDVLRGQELTEAMVRTQMLGHTKQADAKTTASTKLMLTNSSHPGIYYYIPALINRNDNYGTSNTRARAQSAVFLPPVMVVYRPEIGDIVDTTIDGSTTSSLNLDDEKATCALSNGMQVRVPGFDAWLYDRGDFVNGVTEAKSADGSASITYQWYETATKTNTGGKEIDGCSGTAVYDGFDRPGGKGIYWRCGGLSEEYINSLKATANTSTKYYYQKVTITANGGTFTITSDPCELNLYRPLSITGFTVDESDAPAGNITAGVAEDGSIATNATITVKSGATNVMFTPKITGAPGEEDNFDGSVVLTWTCNYSDLYTGNYFLSDWLPTEEGVYWINCKAELKNANGSVLNSSATKGFSVRVTQDTASVFTELPVFDVEKQSQPQYIGLMTDDDTGDNRYSDIRIHLKDKMFGAARNSLYYVGDFRPTIFKVYRVDSADQNRGGTLIFDSEGADGYNYASEYKLKDAGATNSIRTEFSGTFKLRYDLTDHVFSDYGTEYYYIKAINQDSDGNPTGVAYSPTFPVIPTKECVSGEVTPPDRTNRRCKVTDQPYETTWVKKDGTEDVTLNVGLELKNIPLAEYVDRADSNPAHVLYWQYYSGSEWSSVVEEHGIEIKYKTDTCTASSRDYTVNGSISLKIPASLFADGSRCAYLWNNDSGNIKLRLTVDPDSVYTLSEEDTDGLGSTNPQPVLELEIVRVEGNLPTIYSAQRSGGRQYLKWNSSTGDYDLTDAEYLDYSVIPQNEYWLFSDRFDRKTADDYGNKPGSKDPLILDGYKYTSANAVVWQVELPDGTRKILDLNESSDYPDSFVYASGEASDDGTWLAYENKVSISNKPSSKQFTLTVDAPTCDEALVMKATPIAVVYGEDGVTWAAAKAGQTYTIRVNPVLEATEARVYGSGTYYFNLKKSDLPYTITAEVTPADNSVLTCQWYRRSVNNNMDLSSSTPVGTPIVLEKGATVSLALTKEVLQAFASEDGSGTAYFFLCVDSYNADAIKTKTARAKSGFYAVSVNDNYRVAEPPKITPGYGSTDPVFVLYGNEEPAEMHTVTVTKATFDCSQSIRFCCTVRDPDTGEVVAQSEWIAAAIETDENGNITSTRVNGDREGDWVRENNDGTVTCSIDSLPYIGSYVSTSYGRYYDYDLEFYWKVRNHLGGNIGQYVTNGNIATARSETFTVQQRRAEKPAFQNTAVTLDSYAKTTDIPYDDISEAVRAGLGVSVGSSVPAFLQHPGRDTARPVSYVPSLSADKLKSGDTLLAGMEYFDTTPGEDGRPKGWTPVDRGYINVFDSNGNELSVSCSNNSYVQTSDKANYLGFADVLATENKYAYCPGDAWIFLRVALTAQNGEHSESASDPAYSQPFALVRPTETDGKVDADKPVYNGSYDSELWTFVWNKDDKTVTEHSFGAENWRIGEDGTGAGELSYRWQRYSKAASNYVDIPDNATAATPVLTVSREEIEAWSADANIASNGKSSITFLLTVTNTNNDPSITGARVVTSLKDAQCYYGAAPATPVAAATVNGNTTATATAGDADLTASVSVTGQGGLELDTLSYEWQYRVVSATAKGKAAPYNAPDAKWHTAGGSADEYSIPTSDSTLVLYVPYDDSGATQPYMVSVSDLWAQYDSVTVEYRCRVVNSDSGESTGAYSSTLTVTMSIPAFDLTTTGKYADGSTAETLRVTTDRSVILSVPERDGCTYRWVRCFNAAGTESMPVTDATGTSLTVTADNYDGNTPYFACEITHTDTGITRRTTPFFVGIENADGSAVLPTISSAPGTSLYCDVNGAERSFAITAISPDGGTLSYQWQERKNGTWFDLYGETADSLDLSKYDDAVGQRTFSCVVTNTRGESSISASSGTFTLTVRGVVLEDVTITPVAGLTFETTLTATVYGLNGKTVAWATSGSAAYTIEAVDTTTDSSVDTVTATLSSKNPQAATLTVTATVTSGETIYKDTASVKLSLVDFTINTEKITCTLGEAMSSTVAVIGARPETGWSWSGDKPAGLSISDSGTVSGKPTIPGAYQVTLENGSTKKTCTVIVKSPAAGQIEDIGGALSFGTGDEYKSVDLQKDGSGNGWSWSSEAGVLTLDSSYTGGKISFYSSSSSGGAPFYIRMNGPVAVVNGDLSCSNSEAGLYLYGSGSLTVNSPAEEQYGIYLNGGTLYDRRTGGDLTVTNTYTGSRSSYGVYGSIEGAGAAGSVTIQNLASGSATYSYGVSGNVVCTGSNPVSIKATLGESRHAVYGVQGDLTQNGSGAVTIDVDSSVNAPGQPLYGVSGTLTQNSTGDITVTMDQNEGQVYSLTGVNKVVLNNSGPVNITANGHDHANYVQGVNDLTTDGTVDAEITGKNGTNGIYGVDKTIDLGHTGGSVKLNASGSISNIWAALNAPANTSGYLVTGAPSSGSVTYTAAENKTPIFTVNGTPFTPGNASYLLNLQQGEAMEKLTVTANCVGGCTLTCDDTGKPNGLNVAKTSNVITVSGTPGSNENKTGSFQIYAKVGDEVKATLTVNWTLSDLKLLVGPNYDNFDLNGNWQVRVGQKEYIYFFAVGEQPATLQLFDGKTMLSDSLSYVNCRLIYSVDSAATRYTNAYCYLYDSFDASGMNVGDTKTLTVKALDSSGKVLRDMTVNVTAVDAACPYYIGFSNNYGYYNLGLYDYSGSGWTWNKNSLQLTLDDYSSSSEITCSGGPLNLRVQRDSSLGIINAMNGLKITGSSGSTLTVNNTQTNSEALYMYSGHDLIVDTDGSVIIKSAGKVLYGTSTVKLGANVQMLRMEGKFSSALTPAFDEVLTSSYYLYNGTAGAAETPGVFLYGTGTNIPDYAVTIDGGESVTVDDPATLTAAIPAEITGAHKYDTNGEDKGAAFAVAYQWERYNDSTDTWEAIAGETDADLTPSTATAGTTQYRCTVTVSDATMIVSKSQSSDAITFTVKPPAEISGEISDRTIKVTVTGLADGVKATVIVAQYSGGKLVDVKVMNITGTGSDIPVEATFTDENGDSYKIFLLSSDSAPLCGAKSPGTASVTLLSVDAPETEVTVSDDVTASDEPAVSDDAAASDEPTVSDEPTASDDAAASDDPTVSDEPTASDDAAASDIDQ